ncbi:hypothetical protein [Aureliella helgolandensis]|uniref:hypothetical protein n=1 Tax=Aureliella helgolandensis TaxID=2527968 RepID=UPI0011A00AE9|nr:hypothetical protein [Aureliella helgolandensis]
MHQHPASTPIATAIHGCRVGAQYCRCEIIAAAKFAADACTQSPAEPTDAADSSGEERLYRLPSVKRQA